MNFAFLCDYSSPFLADEKLRFCNIWRCFELKKSCPFHFQGNHFYIFNERTDKIKGGKRTISDKWRGIPSSVTSAFQWKNGKTYFFRGDNYWRFDDNTLSKERGYPKSKALYWMGCGAGPDVAEPIRVMPEENEEGGN